MKKIREVLIKINSLLQEGKEYSQAQQIENALKGDDQQLWDYLVSSELWGGSGSIADQALLDIHNSDNLARKNLESLLVELGKLQLNLGKVNERTAGWVDAFNQG